MNPSDADQQGEPPDKKPQIGRREIGALLLLLAINWTFVLLFYSRSRNVSTVTAQDAAIQGTLEHAIRYPARDKNARPTTEFSTRVPDFADTKALDTLLQKQGVVVTAKAPPGTPWWETLLAGFGPTILFFGLWYLVMKRSGSGSMFSFGSSKALVLVFFVQIPVWVYLGGWFLYQLVEGHAGLTSASANGGGVAFFAHVGGFAFGALVTLGLLNAGRIFPQSTPRRSALAPL